MLRPIRCDLMAHAPPRRQARGSEWAARTRKHAKCERANGPALRWRARRAVVKPGPRPLIRRAGAWERRAPPRRARSAVWRAPIRAPQPSARAESIRAPAQAHTRPCGMATTRRPRSIRAPVCAVWAAPPHSDIFMRRVRRPCWRSRAP